MSNYLPTNLKRKELELDHLDDDAFDFTISCPASKIRRLDADLRPTVEVGETDMNSQFEQQPFSGIYSSGGGESRSRGLVIEELPPDENQERAIVLFKPINTPIYRSPSSYVVDSNLMSSIHNNSLWEINPKSSRYVVEEGSEPDEQLAVIPWIPAQQMHHVQPLEVSEMEVSEPMDAEEMGTTMEAEDNMVGPGLQSTNEFDQPNWSHTETLQQWQQQHCIFPQLPQSTTSPIIVV
ncbi:hypothetical protein V2J09_009566 [Rumex salicifolius]